jgi:hypothetical protein
MRVADIPPFVNNDEVVWFKNAAEYPVAFAVILHGVVHEVEAPSCQHMYAQRVPDPRGDAGPPS